jgi:hypothetical protein
MEKHIVFFLHGVGDQKAGWSKEHTDNLKIKANKIISDQNLEPLFEVEYVELFYADILAENTKAMIAGGESLGEVNEFLKKGLEEREDPNYEAITKEEKIAGVLRDYALDVPTYALNPDFRDGLLVTLATQVTATIAANPDAWFSLVSHSLGTKVSFDLLHKLYLGEHFNVTPSGKPTYGSPSFYSYYQLASVAWVIGLFDSENYNLNNSYVRAARTDLENEQSGVISDGYRIFNNSFDPVALIGMANKIDAKIYHSLDQLKYIDRAMMHDLSLYIKNPEVHLKMVEDFYGVSIDPVYKKQTIDAYNTSDENLKAQFKELYDQLKVFINEDPEPTSVLTYVKKIQSISKKIKTILA